MALDDDTQGVTATHIHTQGETHMYTKDHTQ